MSDAPPVPVTDPAPVDAPADAKTYTQADIDRAVQSRLAREAAKYAGFDDIKAKAARLDEMEAKSKTELEREKDARTAAEAKATEAATKAQRTIVRAEVKAAAAGKLADPADALLMLDLDSFNVGDDGEVDTAAIEKAIAELLKAKQYLGVGDGKETPPNWDGGARGSSGKPADVSPGLGRLRRAYETPPKK